MKRLYEFVENERIRITAIQAPPARKQFYESIGLWVGTSVTVFLRDKKRMILRIGKNKFAFSRQTTTEIYGEKV